MDDKHVHIYLLDIINGMRGMLYVEIDEVRVKGECEQNVEEQPIIPAGESGVGVTECDGDRDDGGDDLALEVVADSRFSNSVFSFSDGLNITIGHEFENKEAAQEFVRKGAAVGRLRYTTLKSDKKLWEIRCKFAESGCNLKLRTTLILNSERWSVRKHILMHSCKPVSETSEALRGTKKLVRDYLKEEFSGKLDSTPSAHEIVDRVKAKYGTTRNPGTIVGLELDKDGKSFKYLFFALGATVRGWNYMRKVIAIDATFLVGQYKGTLVVATAQDGDHHLYPLAWGVIDREKDASWRWFMKMLIKAIPDGPDVVVIYDRHRSIIKAISEVYKEAGHGFCARHIAQNLKVKVSRGMGRKSLRGETIVERFFKCAKAYTLNEFENLFNDMKDRYPKVAEYMQKEEIDPKKWARCKFKHERYNLLTTNTTELINSAMKKVKRFPVLGLVDMCVSKTVEWFDRYRVEAGCADDSQKMTPHVDKVMHERYETACTYEVIVLNTVTEEFEVRDEKGRKHFVSIEDRTCSCRVFDIDKIPCSHAIAALHKVSKANVIPDLCSPYYTREAWRLAYQETMYSVLDCYEWIIDDPDVANLMVMPPIMDEKWPCGRPKQNRYPGPGEVRKRIKCVAGTSTSTMSERTTILE
ncbi:PREDICTED: uncharacterized protein LOC104815207 [Tarenaya hassleriana]|uniref:uncharacterized protein LOC104815207 n=1 Tax=Tarenaya hassleriana TaxID=28532 RepID=UPI00053C88EE|nr:PREDICTED: uncharacterized protein LOC104815207 [Tarenaya hassleriana]